MSDAQNLANQFISQIRGHNLAKDKLTELLEIVNEQLDKYQNIQKMIKKEGKENLSHELFQKAMTIASGGRPAPIREDEWSYMMPNQVKQLKSDLFNTLNEGEKAFGDVKAEIKKELSKYEILEIESFFGTTVEKAKSSAKSKLKKAQIEEIIVVSDVTERIATGTGKSVEQATLAARQKIPKNGFKAARPKTTREYQSDKLEISANEKPYNYQLQKDLPEGAEIDTAECLIQPKKGFLSFGKQKGTWKVVWYLPTRVEIKYKFPAEVKAKFYR